MNNEEKNNEENLKDAGTESDNVETPVAEDAAQTAHQVGIRTRDDHPSTSAEAAYDLFCRFFCRRSKLVNEGGALVRVEKLGRSHTGANCGNEKAFSVFKRKTFGECQKC